MKPRTFSDNHTRYLWELLYGDIIFLTYADWCDVKGLKPDNIEAYAKSKRNT